MFCSFPYHCSEACSGGQDISADNDDGKADEVEMEPVVTHDSVHLYFDAEAAELLPMVVWYVLNIILFESAESE